MDYNASAFTHNRSAQILAMYGITAETIKKSQEQEAPATENTIEKSEQAVVVQEVAQEQTNDLNKSQEQGSLEKTNVDDDFNKSLEALMAPITFD